MSHTMSQIISSAIAQIRAERRVRLYCPDARIRYLILARLSRLAKVWYIVETEQVAAISAFLNRWKDFPIDTETAVYPRDLNKVNFNSRLVIADAEVLFQRMLDQDYKMAPLVVIDHELEHDSIVKVIEHIWKSYTKDKFRLILFSGSYSQDVVQLISYQTQVTIHYTDKTYHRQELITATAKRIRQEFIQLDRGCCIVVYIPDLSYEVRLRDQLSQINDYIISSLTNSVEEIFEEIKTSSYRPRIVLTTSSTDVRSLADVSVVIDMMLEDFKGQIRYISHQTAEHRLQRANMPNSLCYRMIKRQDMDDLPETHFFGLDERHQLALYSASESHLKSRLGSKSYRQYQDYIQQLELVSGTILTDVGRLSLNFDLKSSNFVLIDNWNKQNRPLFPLVLATGLLELGKASYFLKQTSGDHLNRNRNRNYIYGTYYGRDDVETFYNLILDLMKQYGGLPHPKDATAMAWLYDWSQLRQLNYQSLRQVIVVINRLLQSLAYANYRVEPYQFDIKLSSYVIANLASTIRPRLRWNSDKQMWYDKDGNYYHLPVQSHHTIDRDRPDTIVALEYQVKPDSKLRYLELTASQGDIDEIPILEPYSFQEMHSSMMFYSEFVKEIDLNDYIDQGAPAQRLTNQKYKMERIRPRLEAEVDSVPVINKYIIRDRSFYTLEEDEAISKTLRNSRFNKITPELTPDYPQLPHRSIDGVLDVTANWKMRGETLIAKNFLTNHVTNKSTVIYIGNYSSHLNRTFKQVNFITLNSSRYTAPNVLSEGKYDLNKLLKIVEQLKDYYIIVTSDLSYQETINLVDKTSATKYLLLQDLIKQTQQQISFYKADIEFIPFQEKQSTRLAFTTSGQTKNTYSRTKLNDQIYYHNLVYRQWSVFSPPFGVPRGKNVYKPEREYKCFDSCFDCSFELDIHLQQLKRQFGNQIFDSRSEVWNQFDQLSFDLRHSSSLYQDFHGHYLFGKVINRRQAYRNDHNDATN